MLIAILIFDAALVAWSLHLLQEALTNREFYLIFAGTLVALCACALMVVYFLMGNCLSHMA